MNRLEIEWKRLIVDEKTCPRCGSTEEEIEKAVSVLRQSLAPLGIDVTLEKGELSVKEFEKNPLESNKILINDHPLEEWVSGTVGQSPCCNVCGPSECRTVTVEGQTYETIPAELIVKAGLIAASELTNTKKSESCCRNNASKTPKNNCCLK